MGIVKISGMKFWGIFLNIYNWDDINGVKSVKINACWSYCLYHILYGEIMTKNSKEKLLRHPSVREVVDEFHVICKCGKKIKLDRKRFQQIK